MTDPRPLPAKTAAIPGLASEHGWIAEVNAYPGGLMPAPLSSLYRNEWAAIFQSVVHPLLCPWFGPLDWFHVLFYVNTIQHPHSTLSTAHIHRIVERIVCLVSSSVGWSHMLVC